MCPCDLSREYVCPGCTAHLVRLIAERRLLEAVEQTCSVEDYDRLREVRGILMRSGLKTEIVKHRMKVPAWEEANAA